MYKKALVCIAMAGTCTLIAESFVVKKQKKSSIKVTCGDELGVALRQSPDMLRCIADIQDMGMELVEQMLDDTLFQAATKEELAKDAQGYKKFNERQTKINQLLEENRNFLWDQQKKYMKASGSVKRAK